MSKLSPLLFMAVSVVSLGCSHQPVDEDEELSTESAPLEEARLSSSTSGRPTVFAIEGPIHPDFNFDYDWSQSEVDVLDDGLGSRDGWSPANKVDQPAFASGIRDKVEGGIGSGPCRLRVQPFKREIGIRCKWTF